MKILIFVVSAIAGYLAVCLGFFAFLHAVSVRSEEQARLDYLSFDQQDPEELDAYDKYKDDLLTDEDL